MSTQNKTLVIDIDHTICFPNDDAIDSYEKYGKATPCEEMIRSIQSAKDQGFEIVLYTARRMATHDGDINKVVEDVGDITVKWLEDHNVPYNQLKFGKPNAVYYIDDKAMRPREFVKFIEWGKE